MKNILRSTGSALLLALTASPVLGQYTEDFEGSAAAPPEWTSFATPLFGVVGGSPFGALSESRALWALDNTNPLRLDVPSGQLTPGATYRLTADLFTCVPFSGTTFEGAFAGVTARLWHDLSVVEVVDFDSEVLVVEQRSSLGVEQLCGMVSLAHTFVASGQDAFSFAVGSDVIWLDNVRILPSAGCAGEPGRTTRSAAGNRLGLASGPAHLGGTLDLVLDLASAPQHSIGWVAFSRSAQVHPVGAGRVLLIGSPFARASALAPAAQPLLRPVAFQFDLPSDPSLCGVVVHAQGAALGAGLRYELSNAVDLTLGG